MFMNIMVAVMITLVVLIGVYGWMVDHPKDQDNDDTKNSEQI